jgi:hypothetical protein
MNKNICIWTLLFLVSFISDGTCQRQLRSSQIQGESNIEDLVGTWRWFCGSRVQVFGDGNFKATNENGTIYNGKCSSIDDETYKFNWENDKWIDVLKISKEGNYLEGKNHAGNHITAAKISSRPPNQDISPNITSSAAKNSDISSDYKKNQKYVGKWKMSSWDGNYELFNNGRVTVFYDDTKTFGGSWFIAYDRLYLIFKDSPVVDVFRLNADENMSLERIDNRSGAGVIFQKK